MKRITPLLLLAVMLLSGCGRKGTLLIEPVSLFYPKENYDYRTEDGVIDYESIDGAGLLPDYEALLGEYFCDPIDEALVNPFPVGTQLLSAVVRGSEFRIRLSQEASALTKAKYALACTCLSMTCFELTACQEVTVISGTRRLTIQRDSWVLLDDFIPTEERQ